MSLNRANVVSVDTHIFSIAVTYYSSSKFHRSVFQQIWQPLV